MSKKTDINRRKFITTSVTAALGAGMAGGSKAAPIAQNSPEDTAKIIDYRRLGRTDFKVSDIGFGCGFFTNSNVMEVGLDQGMNYIDTAEHYAGGQADTAIGNAIKNRDRKKIFITSKLNLTFGGRADKESLIMRMNTCLAKLRTDYVDCLMIHMTATTDQVTHEGFHAAVKELKAEGKVRFTGLSNHGRYYCRHACGSCEPACPNQVPVNTIMRYNHYFETQRREKQAMQKYALLPGANAAECRNCSGPCQTACPHDVPVPSLLTMAHENLSLC